MNEELSSHTLSAQKAVADLKQVTTIRKITIEALSPVIAKYIWLNSYLKSISLTC